MRRLTAILLCVLLAPASALAWSEDGHRLVGDLAERALSPEVRAEALALLAGEPDPSLGGVASWADEMRELPAWEHTAPDHYVRIHSDACRYDAARDCSGGRCVVGAIRRHAALLADRSQPAAERRDALKFLVHFVGDVHQPLHSGHRDDRGGNRFQISLRGEGTNLHSVWDYHVLGSAKLSHAEWVARLEPLPAATDLDAPERWAETSCAHTNDAGFYPTRPGRLPPGYLQRHRPLAEQRIRLASTRLAALLERALGAP